MRIVVARFSVSYRGRGETELPEAVRLILVRRDGTVSVHSDDGLQPQNYMKGPNLLTVSEHADGTQTWVVAGKKESLTIRVSEVISDTREDLEEVDPGLERKWTEAHLQVWLAEHVEEAFGEGHTLVSREYPAGGAGFVDLLIRDPDGAPIAVEVKRTAFPRAVAQVRGYVEALADEPGMEGIRGLVIAIDVRPRARALAEARGVAWMEIPERLYRGKSKGED